ncbi:cytidine deaminase-like protein [Xylaria grammica]|nr:cytidine deaminase-like protein [Xylaria grammica]
MTSIPSVPTHSPSAVITAILKVADERIIPMTRECFAKGGAPFGAAVLNDDSNLEPVAVAVNAWQECPIYHGETNCIRKYSEIPPERRPRPERCVFFATHEPCSLCLSSFAWTGFRIIYFLFTYDDVHRLLGETENVEIIKEVFQPPEREVGKEAEGGTNPAWPFYNKKNKFFSVQSIQELLEEVEDNRERWELQQKVVNLRKTYDEFRRTTADGEGS